MEEQNIDHKVLLSKLLKVGCGRLHCGARIAQ